MAALLAALLKDGCLDNFDGLLDLQNISNEAIFTYNYQTL